MNDVPPPPDPLHIMQSMPTALLLIGPDRKINSLNPAAEDFFGQSARKLVGRPIHQILQFEDNRLQNGLQDYDANMLARQMRLDTANIATRSVDVSISPVVHHNGWQIIALTDALLGSEFLEHDGQESAQFAVRAPEILAHEIKNPLAGIKGAAQLLESRVDESDKELTRLIANEVERVAKLIDNMQSLSRKTQEPGEVVNVHEIIARVKTIVTMAQAKDVKFIEDFDPSLPPVFVSRDSLTQVVLNLVVNAAEACLRSPSPCITITTKFASGIKLRVPGQSNLVQLPIELRISDNGSGVPHDLREHLFSPFVTSKKSGQGLGLALVQKLVRDMQGRIWHERDDGNNLTKFRLFLPVAASVKGDPA